MACERNVDQASTGDEEMEVEEIIDLDEHEEASDYTWDDSDVIPAILSATSISTAGGGLSVNGSTITLTSAGSFRFSGTLSDEQILEDTEDEGVVRILLNGVSISNSTAAPIYIKNASKTIMPALQFREPQVMSTKKLSLSQNC